VGRGDLTNGQWARLEPLLPTGKKPGRPQTWTRRQLIEPDDHGLGRSRGGLTTRLHMAVAQGQKPLSLLVTAGQRHDSPQFQPVLEAVRVPRLGPGPAAHPAGQGPR
jgi:hypothetical protein